MIQTDPTRGTKREPGFKMPSGSVQDQSQTVQTSAKFNGSRMSSPVLKAIVSVSVALAIWELLSSTIFDPRFVPRPTTIFITAKGMILSGELFEHVGISLTRVLIGYVMGAALGIIMGILMGRVRFFSALFDPPIQLIKSISPVAIVPLAIIWFGIGEASKYFVIAYVAVVILALSTETGARLVPSIKLRAAQCLGAKRIDIFMRVVVPSVFPHILAGLRVALGFAFMSVVAAEIIAANSGIGFLIMDAMTLVQTDRMFVGLCTLSVLGLGMNYAFRFLVSKSKAMSRFDLEKITKS